MATLTSGFIELPTQRLDAWLGKVKGGSTVAALSSAIPMKFGKGESFVFDIGEADQGRGLAIAGGRLAIAFGGGAQEAERAAVRPVLADQQSALDRQCRKIARAADGMQCKREGEQRE